MTNDLISREKLLEQTAEWEAAALDHVGKLDPMEDREEWVRWSAILQERTAFKHDVQDAPAEAPRLNGYSVEQLVFVAALLAKNDISPENLASVMTDVGQMVDLLRKEMETNLRNTLDAAMWKGEQDG